MAAGHLTTLRHPLHSCTAPVRGESQLSQVQSLPWRYRDMVACEHPTCQEPGTGRAEPAVSIEDQDWQGSFRSHSVTLEPMLTRAATRPRGAGGRPRATWAEPWSGR